MIKKKKSLIPKTLLGIQKSDPRTEPFIHHKVLSSYCAQRCVKHANMDWAWFSPSKNLKQFGSKHKAEDETYWGEKS